MRKDNQTGFAEYLVVDSYRFLVRINGIDSSSQDVDDTLEEIAPLTDAALTPYRAIKKVRAMLGPGKSVARVGRSLFLVYATGRGNL